VRAFLLGILAAIVVAVVCGYIVLRSGLVPANADAEPGWLEIWAANTSLDATLDRDAPKGPNPVALTDDNLVAGVELYGRHCAICHGTAKGDASASPVAKGLYPGPPQLATDGYALVGKHPDRRADLDPRAVSESHEQASVRRGTSLAEGAKLSRRCSWLQHVRSCDDKAEEARKGGTG